MTRPVIGICTSLVHARWGVWDQRAALTPLGYLLAIQRADGLVLMVPPDPQLEEYPDEALDLIDGLILAGGDDIDPSSYGAEPHPQTKHTVVLRDRVELALTRRAVQRDMPVLGVCRGMQLLNVAFGGTLLQHLPDEVGHGAHRLNPGSFDGSDHDVQLHEGSVAARAAGEELHSSKSHHHQGLDQIGLGLVVSGHSTLDELPEAIEMPGKQFVLGVQWHPEADENSRVLEALVEAARAYRVSRQPVKVGRPPLKVAALSASSAARRTRRA
jgi:putative glutamine amidotransferase